MRCWIARIRENGIMPTLPLFTPPPDGANASASRQIVAPGGTEWWHVDAEDRAQDLLIVIDVFAGSPFDDGYRNQVRRFMHNPTVMHPPSPRDHAMALVAVYRDGICIGSLEERVSRDAFSASPTSLDVRCGPLRLAAVEDSIRVTCDSPDLKESPSLDLTWTPRLRVAPREFSISSLGRPATFLNWVCGMPSYDVTGNIQSANQADIAETRLFNGRGFHECTFAAGLLARELQSWTRRRVVSDERTWVLHQFTFQSRNASSLFYAATSTDAGWSALDRNDCPAVEEKEAPVERESWLDIQRSIGDVQIGNVIGRSLVECYGEDHSS